MIVFSLLACYIILPNLYQCVQIRALFPRYKIFRFIKKILSYLSPKFLKCERVLNLSNTKITHTHAK